MSLYLRGELTGQAMPSQISCRASPRGSPSGWGTGGYSPSPKQGSPASPLGRAYQQQKYGEQVASPLHKQVAIPARSPPSPSPPSPSSPNSPGQVRIGWDGSAWRYFCGQNLGGNYGPCSPKLGHQCQNCISQQQQQLQQPPRNEPKQQKQPPPNAPPPSSLAARPSQRSTGPAIPIRVSKPGFRLESNPSPSPTPSLPESGGKWGTPASPHPKGRDPRTPQRPAIPSPVSPVPQQAVPSPGFPEVSSLDSPVVPPSPVSSNSLGNSNDSSTGEGSPSSMGHSSSSQGSSASSLRPTFPETVVAPSRRRERLAQQQLDLDVAG